ncbi:MAG: alpha/beta hydrolase [Chloroflexi bacterium]|nr:alpha/beta hydrolase [Chloroflexota bacterium]
MTEFERQTVTLNGCDTVVLKAGHGEPLVYFHGMRPIDAPLNFALAWADRFTVYVPFHPGFGESGDDPSLSSIHDYNLHYLDVFDALGIGYLTLVGHDFGAWLAAVFAGERNTRVQRLVLASPYGLRVSDAPSADPFRDPPSEAADVDGRVAQYRESVALARLMWERNYDLKLPRWLERLSMPTLLQWGVKDRVTPAAQSSAWCTYIPAAQVHVVPEAEHQLFENSSAAVQAVSDFLKLSETSPSGRGRLV